MRAEKTKVTVQSWAFSACLCFAGGIGAGIVGSVLTSLSWIIGAAVHPWVRGIGTALLIVTIPLLILAGHCLDRLDGAPNKTSSVSRAGTGKGPQSVVPE